MSLLQTILAFIVALGTLIAFHEFGHYIVGRWCGVKVLVYCIGFGKPIYSRRFGPDQTEFALAAFPLGGYVKFLDEREGPVAPHELHRAFTQASVAKRFAIVAAGPIANFLLAIALYYGLFLYGVDEPKAILATPPAASLAINSGLNDGDQVLKLNDEAVASWVDLRWKLLNVVVEKGPARLEVAVKNGSPRAVKLDLSSLGAADVEGDFMGKIGLALYRPQPSIGKLFPGPAQTAGLQTGDRLVSIATSGDAEKTVAKTGSIVIGVIRANPGKPLKFEIERAGQVLQVTVTPDAVADAKDANLKVGRIAAEIGAQPAMTNVSYGIGGAFTQSLRKTWEMSILSLRMLGKMLVGQVSVKNLSGPLTIADYAGQSAQIGLYAYLSFLAVISISLGVLNLLPIPLLDGGHLVYYSWEFLRGKPVSERVMEIGQMIGMGLLGLLMIVAFHNDIQRLFGQAISAWIAATF